MPPTATGRLLALVALAILLTSGVCLTLAWYYSFRGGLISGQTWSENHGAWYHDRMCDGLLGWAVSLPVLSFLVALLSIPFRPGRLGRSVAVLSLPVSLLILLTHGWLID